MRKTFPAFAMSALALAVAALNTSAQAANGSVTSSAGHAMTAPLVVTPAAPATSNTVANPSGTAATNVTTNPNSTNANPDPFGPNSTFANDNGNPELGQSPGQTSSGTLAGNSSNGIGTGTETLGNPGSIGVTTNTGTNGVIGETFIPGDMTGNGHVGGGGVAYGISPAASSGGSVNTTIAVPATTNTPLLNQVTRTEIAKQEQQRAEGRTPRVIGIAPRTNVDRTNQMPDDPIIRY